jgi:hypothetical protein
VSLGDLANALGDVFTIEGLIFILDAVGLWRSASWGWKLSVSIIAVGIMTSIPILLLGSVGAAPPIVVNLVLLYYLSRPATQRELGRDR